MRRSRWHAVEVAADLADADLREPDLTDADLREPDLTDADLTTDLPAVRMAVGAITIVAAVVVAALHRPDPVVAALLATTVVTLGVLSAIDLAEQRLPNRITLPLAGATALAVVAGGIARSDIGVALAAMAVGFGLAMVLVVLRFGMGDAKLALTVGTIAAWFGRDAIVATTYAGALAAGAVALVLMIIHRRRDVSFGFGPILAFGSVAGMLVAAPLP